MKPRDSAHLRLALLAGKDLDGNSLLTSEDAQRRADAIWDEISKIGFDLNLSGWQTPNGCPYPAYDLDDPRYNLDSFDFDETGTFAVNAPGISHGDLLKLGRALEIKQRFLPARWSKDLKDNFKDVQKHLDTVEELCWLDRWLDVHDVDGPVPNPTTGLDADWKLIAQSTPLVLEVKNWRGEWLGILEGAHKGRRYDSRFSPIDGKFFRTSADVLNIACISTYFPADSELEATAVRYLGVHKEIDAIVLHSSHVNGIGTHLSIFATEPMKNRVSTLLKPLPREELHRAILIKHLDRNPSGGLVRSIDEALKLRGLID